MSGGVRSSRNAKKQRLRKVMQENFQTTWLVTQNKVPQESNKNYIRDPWTSPLKRPSCNKL